MGFYRLLPGCFLLQDRSILPDFFWYRYTCNKEQIFSLWIWGILLKEWILCEFSKRVSRVSDGGGLTQFEIGKQRPNWAYFRASQSAVRIWTRNPVIQGYCPVFECLPDFFREDEVPEQRFEVPVGHPGNEIRDDLGRRGCLDIARSNPWVVKKLTI